MGMNLTAKEIALIFDALTAKYGRGYSDVPGVAALQAKLSILAEVLRRRESGERDGVDPT